MRHDLLLEPLIQTDTGWHSLPSLLAAMARGEVQGFPALRPHQRPAWHMFLVQLATMALDAAGQQHLPHDEDSWRAALRALTPDFTDDAPWHLIGADRSRPAFLQPADPGGLKWAPVATPDALDMLITSRNHDLKREIARNAAAQDWIFALVSLQTMEGYGGGGGRLHGIARMNAGFSSRVLMGLAPTQPQSSHVDPSAWWQKDVALLLSSRSGDRKTTLLWQEPWPEGHSIDLASLDPLFIEVCRRVRLMVGSDGLVAESSTSQAARVNAKDAKGNVGDPWIPINLKTEGALHLNESGWTADLLVKILFSDPRQFDRPSLALLHSQYPTEPMALVCEGLARGQSKTDGFKSRIVPVPVAMIRALFSTRPTEVAPGILADIADARRSLADALRLVACGGDPEKLAKAKSSMSARNRLNSLIKSGLENLERQADILFFPELWRRMAATDDGQMNTLRVAFLEDLSQRARAEFLRGLPAIPCATLMRPRAETRGRQALERGLHHAIRKLRDQEMTHVAT